MTLTMTGDIKIRWNLEHMTGDFLLEDNDLETDEGLGNAVLVSVFTDRRARKDQRLPDPTTDDLRGWWGDTYSKTFNDPDGSHLWLLEREKTEATVIPRCEQYVNQALQWMIDDGVVNKIEVKAFRLREPGQDMLGFRARMWRLGDVEPSVDLKFDNLWTATFDEGE